MSKTMDSPRQLTVTQVGAARVCGVSDRTIRRWEKDGLIKAKQVGGVRLYPVRRLMELVGVDEDGRSTEK